MSDGGAPSWKSVQTVRRFNIDPGRAKKGNAELANPQKTALMSKIVGAEIDVVQSSAASKSALSKNRHCPKTGIAWIMPISQPQLRMVAVPQCTLVWRITAEIPMKHRFHRVASLPSELQLAPLPLAALDCLGSSDAKGARGRDGAARLPGQKSANVCGSGPDPFGSRLCCHCFWLTCCRARKLHCSRA